MRRQHWSAPVLGMLLLLAGSRHALAQYAPPYAGGPSDYTQVKAEAFPRQPYPYQGGPHQHPDGDPYGYGGPYVTDPAVAYGTGYIPTHHQVSVGPVGHAAYQPQMLPYPEVSPYMEGQFNQTFVEDGLWKNDSNSRGRQYFFDLEYLFGELRKPSESLVGSDNIRPAPYDPTNLSEFPYMKVSDGIRQDLEADGIRARFGYWNPDDSGLVWDAWWMDEGTGNFNEGLNPTAPFDVSHLQNTQGIPLYNGTASVTVPYDRLFQLTFTSEAMGTSLDFLMTPWLKNSVYRVRPMGGMRYIHLKERFSFVGADSALVYLFDERGFGIPASVGPNPIGNPAYESFLDSKVYSHMFGPEIGLQYELGGKNLLIGGYSKVALLGNREKLTLRGNNIGDGFGAGFGGLQSQFPANNPFSSRQDTWHLSPAFEQNFFVEFPIFGIIPYLNKSWLFENAKFRGSYNFLYVAEVARPDETIEWYGLPLYPQINVDRSHWFTRSWSVGVHWEF